MTWTNVTLADDRGRRSPFRSFVLATLFLLVGGLVACSGPTTSLAVGTQESASTALKASGFIEAQEVSVVSEVGGLVAEVLVNEADSVTAGQVVVVLDDTLLRAQRAQAEAAVSIARANLAHLRAGASQEELAAAQAAIDEIEARIKGLRAASAQAWGDVSNPQSVDVQLASTRAEADLARRQAELARLQLEEAQIKLDWLRQDDPRDNGAIEFQEYAVQILEANLRAAEIRYQGALRKIELLEDQRERPLTAIATARSIASQIPILEAQRELAQARYDLLANGALPEEIAIAEAQVALAEANVALIDAQIARLTLIAPVDGVVTTRAIHPGETASPGVALLTISDLEQLKLVVYIPETQIGRVRLGAPVSITVDAYPSQTFDGVVTFIAREAEFTPRNVQTEEERVNLVFAVEIQIDNRDGKLKPGMPADAVIETDD